MQRERETGRTPFKCYSSVSGQKDRGLLSTAGDEKQAHVCFMSTYCSVCVLVWDSYSTGVNILAPQSEAPILQAIKQAIITYIAVAEKMRKRNTLLYI